MRLAVLGSVFGFLLLVFLCLEPWIYLQLSEALRVVRSFYFLLSLSRDKGGSVVVSFLLLRDEIKTFSDLISLFAVEILRCSVQLDVNLKRPLSLLLLILLKFKMGSLISKILLSTNHLISTINSYVLL